MRWRYILNITGWLIFFLGASMALPLLVESFSCKTGAKPLLFSLLVTLGCGGVLVLLFRIKPGELISTREGIAVVALCWVAAGFFGAFPFYFSGIFDNFTDAFFESVSGFTTTGASVMTDIENIGRGYLLWRSFIQWLGGMGIIVLSVAILPFLGVGGMQLYKAEVPSPVPDKLQPRISDTAKTLWKVYLLISLGEMLLLKLGGMTIFDAVCHTFTTMPTGGFSTRNQSIAGFDSPYFDMVILFFMLMAGINFSLHYQMLKGDTLAFWKDPECRFFIITVLVLILVVSSDLYGKTYDSVGEVLRYGSFQVVSIITTTGYATADYETWPALSQLLLFFCMFLGASAGSTGGGMKIIRLILCLKYCYKELFARIHPKAVTYVKLAGKTVPKDVLRGVLGFLCLYVLIFIAASFLLAALEVDAITALAAVAASLGNIGPGFGAVGPTDNFSQIPMLGKWLLTVCMLLGRLEIYTIILLVVPEFWRK